MTGSSKNVRRSVAIALLLLSASVLGFAIAWPAVQSLNREYAAQTRLEDRVARARARAAELPRMEAIAAEQSANPLWGLVYRGGDVGAASAEFERDVRSVLGPKYSAIPMERLGAISRGDLRELGVRLRVTVTAADLADALQRVENAPKLLRTRALKVGSPLSQRGDRNEPLESTLEVVGYWIEQGPPK